jgi:hypothetical protein
MLLSCQSHPWWRGLPIVEVRRMHPYEAKEVLDAAKGATPEAAPLTDAVAHHPERVRVAHIGHEHVGAFVLTELDGGVEELSGLALTEEGLRSGAERAVVEYVVSAAKFGGKRALEVVAPEGSAEARHLLSEGFHAQGDPARGLARFRIDFKAPAPPRKASASARNPGKAKRK